MRKVLRRVLGALMSALMIVSVFTGCDKKDSSTDPSNGAETPEFVYIPEYISLPEEITDISNVNVVNDKMIFSSVSYDDPDTGTYTTKLYSMNLDGTGLAELTGYVQGTAPEGAYGSFMISAMSVDGQGNIWVAESGYFYTYDLPDDFNPETDDQWQYYVDLGQQMAVRKLDDTGAELLSLDIGSIINLPPEQQFYLSAMNVDDKGDVLVTDGSNAVYVIGESGTVQFKLEITNWVDRIVRLSDGNVAVSGYTEEGYMLRKIDFAAKDWGEEIEMPYMASTIYPGGGEYSCAFGDSSSLYGLDAATGKSTKLLTWINCDVNSDSLGNVNILPDGRILCTNYIWDNMTGESSYELIIMNKVPSSEVEQKTILTLATMYLNYNLKSSIIEFNKTNTSYRIQVKDYSEFNTEEDYNAGLTKLSTEIISGQVPDMLDVSGLPIKQYVAKGLLEDLYPFIDADSDFGREDFIESVFTAMEMDGGLYQISPSFNVSTVVGHPSVVGEEMGWTMQEFQDVLKAHPEATMPFGQYYIKDDFLNYAMAMGMDQYVDWSTGTCKFNSEDFMNLLEFANTFPSEYNYDDENYVSETELIQTGKQILSQFWLSDFQNIQMYEAMFGGEIVFKGFPTENRNGNVVNTYSGLAMSTKCVDKNAAWSFMRIILTEDWQTANITWEMPTNKAVFESMMEEAMKEETATGDDGVVRPVASAVWVDEGGNEIQMHPLTQEEADQIMDLINSVSGTYSYDQNIMDIVKEGADAFFAGQKSAQEAAEIIQNRVSIYVAEQS